MDYIDFINALNRISEAIINSSKLNILEYIIPFILGIIGTLVGVVFGYLVSKWQDSDKFNTNCHIEYLKCLNEMFYKMNDLRNNIVNIDKFGRELLKNDFDNFSFLSLRNNYMDIGLKIRTFQSYLLANTELLVHGDHTRNRYFNAIIEASSSIVDVNTMTNIIGNFEKESINYYWLINKSFRDKHAIFVKQLSDYTRINMDGFNIEEFCCFLGNYIKEINDYIRKNNGQKKIA